MTQAANEILIPATLIKRAEAASGLSDWGDVPFGRALGVLCRSGREQRLEGRPLAALEANIIGLLVKRLRLADDRRKYPEIARQKIVNPVFVMGLPRSGTTILHNLLSQDPDNRSPQRWELDDPSPPPRTATYLTDPRIAVAAEAVARIEPEFRAMHHMGAQLPEECIQMQTLAFQSLSFWSAIDLPLYTDWLLNEADARLSYEFHKQYLQHLQAFAPRTRWVLKAPTHLFWIEELLEVYPDASIVFTHRDPAEVLPSNASLIAFLRSRVAEPDPKAVGAEQVKVWSLAVRRAMAARARIADSSRFIDTHYGDFITDPLAVVRRVYSHFAMPMTAKGMAAMGAFMDDNEQGKHGKHVYTAEQFGLDPAAVHRAFADYIATYGVRIRGA